MNVPTFPPPTTTTRTSMSSAAGAGTDVEIEVVDVISGDRDEHGVAVLDHEIGTGELRHTETSHRDDVSHSVDVELGDAMPRPRRGNDAFDDADLRTWVDPLDRRRVGQDAAQNALDRPLHRGHG